MIPVRLVCFLPRCLEVVREPAHFPSSQLATAFEFRTRLICGAIGDDQIGYDAATRFSYAVQHRAVGSSDAILSAPDWVGVFCVVLGAVWLERWIDFDTRTLQDRTG